MSAEANNNNPGSAGKSAPAAPSYHPAPPYAAPYAPVPGAGADETARRLGALPGGLFGGMLLPISISPNL
jgi:hypothetical protein